MWWLRHTTASTKWADAIYVEKLFSKQSLTIGIRNQWEIQHFMELRSHSSNIYRLQTISNSKVFSSPSTGSDFTLEKMKCYLEWNVMTQMVRMAAAEQYKTGRTMMSEWWRIKLHFYRTYFPMFLINIEQ